MPVASRTSTPGRPCAKRVYQAVTAGVTSPVADARHGTIAGTHVRVRVVTGPSRPGAKSRELRAVEAVGHAVGGRWRVAGCMESGA